MVQDTHIIIYLVKIIEIIVLQNIYYKYKYEYEYNGQLNSDYIIVPIHISNDILYNNIYDMIYLSNDFSDNLISNILGA